jgi:serine/threonine protein kinase
VSLDALQYALGSLGCGIRRLLGAELEDTPREELVKALSTTFHGAQELKGALEEAFERSVQSLVVGLKQAWLLMETGGDIDYCESFGTRLRSEFVTEEGLEGRLFIDFLDGFFLDYDTAVDSASAVLGLPDLEGTDFFGCLLSAAEGAAQPNLVTQATSAIREGFIGAAGLEEEHPILRLGCWRNLLAEGLHFHFTDLAKTHPVWSRYLELFSPEALERETLRAIVSRDTAAQAQLDLVRELLAAREAYAENFGDILPNREWLFDIAERLEDIDETVESDLLKGRAIAAQDLPKIVAAGVGKVHAAQGTSSIARLSDALIQPSPGLKDVLRRARRDFRRSHWGGEEYGNAALELAGALLPLAGPSAAERYYREARAFGADLGVAEFGLYLTSLVSGELKTALGHLIAAAKASPERFELFDFNSYTPLEILGAGGGGPSFMVELADGGRAVVKTFWDSVAVVDPRGSLKPRALIHKQIPNGVARMMHLGVQHKQFPYVVTEFVEGDDLESFREARGGHAPAALVATIGAMIAGRLSALHAVGSVHGNLSPGNVRIGAGEDGLEVTLLDPSIPNVLLAAPERVPGVRKLLAWSRAGRVIAENFASFTAPEVVAEGLSKLSVSSDLYALGGILYRLATGAPPRNPDPGAVPDALRDAVMGCLIRDPAQRYSSAVDLQQALLRAAEAPSAPAAAPAPTAPPPPPQPAAPAGFDPFQGLGTSNPDASALAPAGPPGIGLPTPADPFAPTVTDPFAAPGAPADPFAAPADPFAAPAAADPFAAPASADPFAAPASADPFAAPGALADPFAAPADPFAAPAADAFAMPGAPVGADPFAAPPGADPFAAPPGADPFAAPAGADPFAAPPGADPFAAPAGADPFAAPPGADPFAAPAGADPFAAPPGADPFAAPAGADPFAMPGPPVGADPFAAPAGADPFAAPAGADPFAAPAGADPFAAPAGADPFAMPGAPVGADPFAAPAGLDPFAAPGLDPFAAPPGLDPFAAPGGLDPFAAPMGFPVDPLAMPGGDPFANPIGVSADPFAPPEEEEEALDPSDALALLESLMGSGKKASPAPVDPFAAPAGLDPFAAPAGADPFAAPAGVDPFAAPAGVDPFAAPAGVDPFAAPAGVDPFAAPAGVDPFAAPGAPPVDPFAPGAAVDPFAPPPGGGMVDPFAAAAPDLQTTAGGLWLSEEQPAPNFSNPPPQAAAPPPPARRPARKAAGGATYGLVISGLGLKSKKDAAVKIVMILKGIDEKQARDMCRSPVVPVLKGVSKEEADGAAAQFKAAKVNCRVTTKKRRK